MARIRFRFEHPRASTVALVGDFNDWSPTAHPMQRSGEETWTLGLDLAPGRYEYKFLVDGQEWWNDRNAPKVPNVWGTENSYVDIP